MAVGWESEDEWFLLYYNVSKRFLRVPRHSRGKFSSGRKTDSPGWSISDFESIFSPLSSPQLWGPGEMANAEPTLQHTMPSSDCTFCPHSAPLQGDWPWEDDKGAQQFWAPYNTKPLRLGVVTGNRLDHVVCKSELLSQIEKVLHMSVLPSQRHPGHTRRN